MASLETSLEANSDRQKDRMTEKASYRGSSCRSAKKWMKIQKIGNIGNLGGKDELGKTIDKEKVENNWNYIENKEIRTFMGNTSDIWKVEDTERFRNLGQLGKHFHSFRNWSTDAQDIISCG